MLTNSTPHGIGQAGTSWIPDSGASFHVTGDSQNIKQFTHFDGPNQIFIGNGEGLSISNTGSSSFVFLNDVGITFKVHKLLHVPSISKNLLSVSQFAKDNSVFFEFHPHSCLVKSQETNKILLKGVVGVDGLYSFHNLKLQDNLSLLMFASTVLNVDSPSSTLTVNNNSSTVMSNSISSSLNVANLWHARLGHPNDHLLKIVLTHCNIDSLNKNSIGFCSSCCMGTSHRLPSHGSSSAYSFRAYFHRFVGAFSYYLIFWL